ncbi:Ribosome biogenesis ALB1 protein [Rutstroemia sp. NJR-2017a BBW]|nr:Ribosome biogenesis ALB1 protein [Rutstroemia sp. NJR-2017a BBW]
MASTSNPNVPKKQRRIANRAKSQRRNAVNKVTKNPRGTRQSAVLHPTSGPLAPVSGKKARKLEKAQRHARQRALEKAMKEEGEVQMTDAPKNTESKSKKENEEGMEIDNIA